MGQPYLILQSETLITVASWEERFRLGVERIASTLKIKRLVMFYYLEYEDWSSANRQIISKLFSQQGCSVVEEQLSFKDPVQTWKTISSIINNNITTGELITLDITTMPREAIWTSCDCIKRKNGKLQYVYNKPLTYAEEWLSRDPGRPRFMYRLAGISRLDVPTTLLIIAGYDTERTKQLVRYYEPRNLVIGLQSGEQYDNIKKNHDKNRMAFDRNDEIRWFDVDGYDLQNTVGAVEANVKDFQKDTNVVLSSLGPKISALALYKYHLGHDNSALSYAPSNEFNRDYSHGLGETLSGQL